MYCNWFQFIGGSVILLQINCLVLLTANVEDIKRIAQKIVPESLAEKLIDFVVKATNNQEINVSQENSENKNDVSANEWTKPKKYRPNEASFRKSKDKRARINQNDRNSNENRPILKSHRQNPYTFIIDRTPAIVSKDRKVDKNFVRSRFIQNADSIQEVVLRTNTMTTEKERTEFDQYDNTNYPKSAGVIATSGRVALTKRPGSESDE